MGGFHHCFFMCFHCLILIFTSVFWMFSSLIAFFHVTSFLYLDCIFPAIYQVLRFCVVVPRVLQIWESLFYPHTTSRNLTQPAFIKVSLEAGSFFLKVAGPPTEVQNTDPTHLFVWSTQYSAKGINRQVLFMCYGPTERYINLFQVLNSLFNSYIYCIVKCHIW